MAGMIRLLGRPAREAVVLWIVMLVLLSPLGPAAQGGRRVWRLGLFHVGLDHVPPSLEPLREALKSLGYEEGGNLRLDWRNLPDEEAAREAARDFVRQRVDLIVAFEAQTVRAAKAATSDIPVVFLHVADPVIEGYARSLSRPGGNLTGLVTHLVSPGKQIELFKEMVPRLRRLLVLTDPDDPVAERTLADVKSAGARLKVHVIERQARNEADLERLFSGVKRGDVDGVYAASVDLQTKSSSLLLRLTSDRRLPLVSHRKEWVQQGALFSYAADLASVGRAAAVYVDKILKGASPADLPVERPSRVELVINLKTARALGLTIPSQVLMEADEVIR